MNGALVVLSSVAGEVADTALLTALKTIRSVPVGRRGRNRAVRDWSVATPSPRAWASIAGSPCWVHAHASAGPLCVIDAARRLRWIWWQAQGSHEGGYILPGADLMRRALTADTGRDSGRCAGCAHFKPGSDTQTCVSAGGWRAVIGAVQSVLADYPEHRALLTGGLAPVLLEMGLSATHHPHLVMEGLRLWLLQTLDDQGS